MIHEPTCFAKLIAFVLLVHTLSFSSLRVYFCVEYVKRQRIVLNAWFEVSVRDINRSTDVINRSKAGRISALALVLVIVLSVMALNACQNRVVDDSPGSLIFSDRTTSTSGTERVQAPSPVLSTTTESTATSTTTVEDVSETSSASSEETTVTTTAAKTSTSTSKRKPKKKSTAPSSPKTTVTTLPSPTETSAIPASEQVTTEALPITSEPVTTEVLPVISEPVATETLPAVPDSTTTAVAEPPAAVNSPDAVAREYFVKSFSAHGDMIEMDVFASGTGTLQNLLAKRRDLLMKRRQTFNLGPSGASIRLDLLAERIQSDTAYLSYRSTETCSFSNPGVKSTGRYSFLVMLVNEQGAWKIKSLLSRDMHFGLFERVRTARASDVHRAIKSGKDLPAKFKLTCTDASIAQRYQLELNNITKDKNASAATDSVPVSTGENRGQFDREAMRQYQATWALGRNKQYADYSNYGGDCQNFSSQVVIAGGSPMDNVGSAQWYYFGTKKRTPSWTSVGNFARYIRNNTDKGPRGVLVQGSGSLEPGDIVHIDWDYDGHFNHAVSICNAGSSPTISGHTNDELNYPLFYLPGNKQYYHLIDYGK